MSEIDDKGNVMSTFTDVIGPQHLSTDMSGLVLVADRRNDRILLLDSQLELDRVLVDRNSKVRSWLPHRLHLNELASLLYVLHDRSEDTSWRDVISQWSLHDD